jgi:hypothetical protein
MLVEHCQASRGRHTAFEGVRGVDGNKWQVCARTTAPLLSSRWNQNVLIASRA